MPSKADAYFMLRALRLAGRGAGLVSPNPMVGAVIVNDGRVVGEGFHRYEQVKHAETIALEMAAGRSRGATLYCSLEPCSHFGRTPPCADALVEAGITRAVIATPDPDTRVSGRGIDRMRQANIQVESGLFGKEARALNEIYFKFVTSRLPFAHAVISRGGSDWTPSKQFLKTARQYDAIILGSSKRVNRLAIENSLSHARHRLLVIGGTRHELAHASASMPSPGKVTRVETVEIDEEEPLRSAFEALAERRVTSALVMAQAGEARQDEAIGLSDKLTIVASAGRGEPPSALAGNKGASFEFVEAETWRAGETLEVTCYPRRPGDGRI